MANHFNDAEIQRLLQLKKELPLNWERRLHGLRASKTLPQTRSQLIVKADDSSFRLSIRRNSLNREDFSVIVSVLRPKEQRWFRLRRYNGLHAPGIHKNRIEKTLIRGFHVHTATLRYQQRGLEEDGYAEATNHYQDVWGALDLALRECGFILPPTPEPQGPEQGDLFVRR